MPSSLLNIMICAQGETEGDDCRVRSMLAPILPRPSTVTARLTGRRSIHMTKSHIGRPMGHGNSGSKREKRLKDSYSLR